MNVTAHTRPAGASRPTPTDVGSAGDSHTTVGVDGSTDPLSQGGVLECGRLINGRYEIENLVGAGGMGRVYRVTDRLHPQRRLALKAIHAASLQSQHLSWFKAEFRVMTTLRHPHLASVYDFEAITDESAFFFTMDYVDGENLFVTSARSDLDAVLGWTVEVARALAYVHSRGIIHFDIKPANVLVDEKGHVKVLDFGLVGAKSNARGGWLLGTPAYMAPEAARRLPTDHRADLYSLGVMLYQLVCRHVPFSATTVVEMMAKHASEPIAFSAEDEERVPEWLRRFIVRLCAKSPADRPRNANAVIEELNRESGRSFAVETGETARSYLLSSRFVGRDEELTRALEFLSRRCEPEASRGAPLCLVSGPSGIGKSRLMREIKHHAQLERVPFVEGNCYEASLSEFDPWNEALRDVVRLADTLGGRALIERFGPELCKLDPTLLRGRVAPSAPLSDASHERVRLLDAVSAFLVDVAGIVPFALYLNDVHWARAGTVDLLRHLVRTISVGERRSGRRVPLAIFASFRDDEITGSPLERFTISCGSDEVLRLGLRPLHAEEVARVLSSMLGVSTLPPAFVDRVAVESGGNGFFVEEIMRALFERGSVYVENGAWSAEQDIGALDIPSSIAAVFSRRVALLPPLERSVFDGLVAVGRPIALDLLAHCLTSDEDSTSAALLSLERRRLVSRVAGPDLVFSIAHDRIREARYAELTADARRSLHRTIAEALESNAETHLYEIARHYGLAEDREKALHYALEGGRRAREGYANGVAIELLERARALLAEDPTKAQLLRSVVEELGDVYALTGRHEEARAAFSAITPAVDRLHEARLLRKIAAVLTQEGKHRDAMTKLGAAAAILGQPFPRGALRSVASFTTSVLTHIVHRLIPRLGPARTERERNDQLELSHIFAVMSDTAFYARPVAIPMATLLALNAGMRAGHEPAIALGFARLAYLLAGSFAQFGLADAYSKRALAMAEPLGPRHRALAELYRGFVLQFSGRALESRAILESARKTFAEVGDMPFLGDAYRMGIRVAYMLGDIPEATRLTREALELMERTGTLKAFYDMMAMSGFLLGETGEDDAASTARLDQGVEGLAQVRNFSCLGYVQMLSGHACLTRGDFRSAAAGLDRARATRNEHGIKFDVMYELDALAARAFLEPLRDGIPSPDDLRRARRLVARTLKSSRMRPTHRPAALIAAAIFAALSRQPRRALHLLDRAQSKAEALHARLLVADCHEQRGRFALLASDRARAQRELSVAAEMYRKSGAAVRYRRVQALL